MLKALFSIAFGLTFGAVLLFVGLLASSAFAAPPGSKVHKCTPNQLSAAKLQVMINAADEGDVVEVEGDCVGFNYLITTDGLTLRGIGNARITGDGAAPAITITGHQVKAHPK